MGILRINDALLRNKSMRTDYFLWRPKFYTTLPLTWINDPSFSFAVENWVEKSYIAAIFYVSIYILQSNS